MWVILSLYFGATLSNNTNYCKKCNTINDNYVAHALQCAKEGSMIQRHDSIRNEIKKIAQEAGYQCEIENRYNKDGERIQGRPGDVVIRQWDTSEEDLYIDVVISNTLSHTNIKQYKNKNINKKKKKN